MKMLMRAVLLLGVVSIGNQVVARIEVNNNTAYEIKVVAHWAGGRGGWAAFPAQSIIRKSDWPAKYVLDNKKEGIKPGKTSHTWDDWSDIKTYWAVWAKVDGKWLEDPVITSGAYAYGGLVSPVRARVTNWVDEDGKPTFNITVETGA